MTRPADERYFAELAGAPEENGRVPEPTAETAAAHSWRPVDIVGRGDVPAVLPSLGGIAYPGARHVYLGEPESMKTWAALALAVEEIRAGRTVVYVDAENGPAIMLERLRQLGLTDEEIAGRFAYLEPSEPLTAGAIRADVDALLERLRPALVVLDSFDALLALHGLDPNASKDVEAFYRYVVGPLRAHGAAVVILDHVTKSKEARGRFAIGSQRKTGAAEVALGFEIVQPFGRGRTGLARIVTHKDRLGHLARPRAAELELRSDPGTGAVAWTFRAAQDATGDTFRPTRLMEKVSRYVEAHVAEEAPALSAIETGVEGKGAYVRQAVEILVAEAYLEEQSGPRGARRFTSRQRYRETDEPRHD